MKNNDFPFNDFYYFVKTQKTIILDILNFSTLWDIIYFKQILINLYRHTDTTYLLYLLKY